MADATQADIDALTAQVTQVANDLTVVNGDVQSVATTLQTEINNLAAANPGVDVTALQAAVAPLDGTAQALDTAVKALGSLSPGGATTTGP